MALVLTLRGAVVVSRIDVARSFGGRLLGLMGRRPLPPGHGLHLAPCGSIHTCFMRFPLDVIFLSGDLHIARIVRNLRPWRAASGGPGAHSALELAAGWLPENALHAGDLVEIVEG